MAARQFLLRGSGPNSTFNPPFSVSPALGGTPWGDTSTSEGTLIMADEATVRAGGFTDGSSSSSLNTRSIDGNYLCKQFVLGDCATRTPVPLVAKTISGTVTGMIRGQHNTGTAQSAAICKIYVVDSTGTVYRGTLFDLAASGTESGYPFTPLATVMAAQIAHGASIALTPLAVQAGDLLVVELGYNYQGTGGGNNKSNLASRGDSALADATTNGDTATNIDTWIEFSEDPLAPDVVITPPIIANVYLSLYGAIAMKGLPIKPIMPDRLDWQSYIAPVELWLNLAAGADTQISVPANAKAMLLVFPAGTSTRIFMKGATAADAGIQIYPPGTIDPCAPVFSPLPSPTPASMYLKADAAVPLVKALFW